MGSIIFSLALHANANLVVFEYSSIVLRMACCAADVMLSASSRSTILCRPGGRVTYDRENKVSVLYVAMFGQQSPALEIKQ